MLSQEAIDNIKTKIAQQFSPKRIYLFGSYAYGNPTSESDLDLLIIDDSESDQVARRKGIAISQALFPRDFGLDLMVYSESTFNQKLLEGWSFFKEVTTKGKLLYERC